MTTRVASCTCGAFRLLCEGDPARVSVCHCRACQRRTGSAFGVQARFGVDQVTIEGPTSTFVRVGDGGSAITFRFCPTCGDTGCWEIEGMDGWLAVPVGAFADASFPAPTVSIYEERAHPWVELHGIVDRME